jgi:hypothetical protein
LESFVGMQKFCIFFNAWEIPENLACEILFHLPFHRIQVILSGDSIIFVIVERTAGGKDEVFDCR